MRADIKNETGYTIIETMIAVSLFIIIVTMGTNALLNANVLHQKSKDMRSILDSMSYALDDMGKNIRTGTIIHCVDDGNLLATNAHSCAAGGGISFASSLGGQWVYYIGNDHKIYKSTTGGGGTFIQLTPDEVNINLATSGFAVLGAEPPSAGDTQEPLVTIRLSGTITTKGVVSPFNLQTSVSQRLVDI